MIETTNQSLDGWGAWICLFQARLIQSQENWRRQRKENSMEAKPLVIWDVSTTTRYMLQGYAMVNNDQCYLSPLLKTVETIKTCDKVDECQPSNHTKTIFSNNTAVIS